jgi:hypothetical protein
MPLPPLFSYLSFCVCVLYCFCVCFYLGFCSLFSFVPSCLYVCVFFYLFIISTFHIYPYSPPFAGFSLMVRLCFFCCFFFMLLPQINQPNPIKPNNIFFLSFFLVLIREIPQNWYPWQHPILILTRLQLHPCAILSVLVPHTHTYTCIIISCSYSSCCRCFLYFRRCIH